MISFLGVRTDRYGFGILTWKHVGTQKISSQNAKLVVSCRSLYASPEDGEAKKINMLPRQWSVMKTFSRHITGNLIALHKWTNTNSVSKSHVTVCSIKKVPSPVGNSLCTDNKLKAPLFFSEWCSLTPTVNVSPLSGQKETYGSKHPLHLYFVWNVFWS